MGLESLPRNLTTKILLLLDHESHARVACVSTKLKEAVQEALSIHHTLHLPMDFSPDFLMGVLRCNRRPSTVILNCLRLHPTSILPIIDIHLEVLRLFRCSLISPRFLATVGHRCPKLRLFEIQLPREPKVLRGHFRRSLRILLEKCFKLESISIEVGGEESMDYNQFEAIQSSLPKTTKRLKLKTILLSDAIDIMENIHVEMNTLSVLYHSKIPESSSSSQPSRLTLTSLSLTVDAMSDRLVKAIGTSLPFLLKLHLEDLPNHKPNIPISDLTNDGLESLTSCPNLLSLSLFRGRFNHEISFTHVNDVGLSHLSQNCRSLESVRFCGFSQVTDVGFSSIISSCHRLHKFEICNAPQLSDQPFILFDAFRHSLTAFKILSCALITHECVTHLTSSTSLKSIDLSGCNNVTDQCLDFISELHLLTSLNLTATAITDNGLSILSQGSAPMVLLSLRSCEGVTDDGIIHLFQGRLRTTLTSLDIGQISSITDRAIQTIASQGVEITELCIRSCFNLTHVSVQALAKKKQLQGEQGKLLRRLDLCNCKGMSVLASLSFRARLFPGLQWLGVGQTAFSEGNVIWVEFCSRRPWLTVCSIGCEIGCHNGWPNHTHYR